MTSATDHSRLSLPRKMRLSRRRDFDHVYRCRCTASDENLVVYAAASGLDHIRFGLVVVKKLGTSVRRHRIRRLLREAARLEQHSLPPGFDYVLIPRGKGEAGVGDYRRSLPPLAAAAVEKWRRTRREPAS